MSGPSRSGRPSSINTIGLTGAPPSAASVEEPGAVPAGGNAHVPSQQPAELVDNTRGASAIEPPPQARRRAGREQFNTQILPSLRRLLDEFVEENDSTYQGVIEQALREYLSARGVDVSGTEEPRRSSR